MEVNKQARLKVWIPLLFALVMILGMTLGYNLHDSLRYKRAVTNVVERSDRLESMIDLINQKYVDTINTNALYEDAVKGILSHLDPHTVYIPADKLAGVNEELQGSFYGIGVEYAIVHDTLGITAVVQDGPASKAGIIPGDKLIKIRDTTVAGVGISTDKIVNMLRGEQKTTVDVTIKKVATGLLKEVPITRDDVPLYSVDAGIMLDKTTGFIKINRFAATTYEEFTRVLKQLKAEGMKALILDLRGNPGGYLDAAANIADEFLDGDKPIVYTQGLHSEKVSYNTDKNGLFERGNLAILVDETSASAAEILAGAVQDYDRGVIIGRRTYGKGLVQEQYDLDDGSALRLTIAHYFTPSGRSIQRPYDKGKEAYDAAFEERYRNGELTGRDSLAKEDTTSYYTSRHRLVRGGGGIKPDIYVPYDSNRLSPGLVTMLLSDRLQDAVFDYYTRNFHSLKQYRSTADLLQRYRDESQMTAIYLQQLTPSERTIVMAILARPANRTFFLLQMKAQLARILFRNNGYFAVNATGDDVVQRALKILHSDQYLKIISR